MRSARLRQAALIAAGLVLQAVAETSLLLWAGDQPQWGERYSRNMASAETGLPDRFDPKSGLNIRWSAALGTSCYSTPVIARGKVFIGTNNGNPRDPRHRGDRGVLMCFNETDGRLLWQLVVPKQPHDPYLDCPGVGITSSAVVDEDRVFVMSNRGEVLCLDIHGLADGNDGPFCEEAAHQTPENSDLVATSASDADILWLYDLRREVGAYTHDSANTSVLIFGDHLYVSVPNGVNHTHRHRPSPLSPALVVLDKRTGRLLAQDDTGMGLRIFHSTFSSPALGVVNGTPLVFYGGADGVCYAFDALGSSEGIVPATANALKPDEGAKRSLRTVWRLDCDPLAPKENIHQFQGNRETSPSCIVGLPVFWQNRVYVAVGGDPWHGKRQVWLKCLDATQRGDLGSKAEHWSIALQRHCVGTPAIANGLVFLGDFGRQLHCLDVFTGKEYWSHELQGEIWGSALVADGRVYVGTREGDFWVFAADRNKRILSRVDFDHYFCSTPAAANRTLYLATMNRLYAIGDGVD